jgi:predicted dithiol-disulfide oxidoreductase (DUF899 family)
LFRATDGSMRERNSSLRKKSSPDNTTASTPNGAGCRWAPLSKLEAYKERQGWRLPWVSSFGSDFNYDFHVTNNETVAPVEYNYRDKAELEANKVPNAMSGEEHGLGVFFRIGDEVFHTYSAYARGTEALTDSRALLDMTPYGRQQDFEDSPPGWPQKPTYG